MKQGIALAIAAALICTFLVTVMSLCSGENVQEWWTGWGTGGRVVYVLLCVTMSVPAGIVGYFGGRKP